jgi:hypothetical protein
MEDEKPHYRQKHARGHAKHLTSAPTARPQWAVGGCAISDDLASRPISPLQASCAERRHARVSGARTMNPLSITVKSSCVSHPPADHVRTGVDGKRVARRSFTKAVDTRTPSSDLLVTLPSSRGDRARMATTVQKSPPEPRMMGLRSPAPTNTSTQQRAASGEWLKTRTPIIVSRDEGHTDSTNE